MKTIVNRAGKRFTIDQWSVIVNMMDDDIREELHHELAPCTEQEFFTAYENAHENRLGMEWELSKQNPQW